MIRRAGEPSVLSLGVTVPRAVISTLIPSSPRTTFRRCSAARVAVPVPGFGVSAAAATRTSISSGRTTPSSCFRISLLPHTSWPSAVRVSFFKLASRFGLANPSRRRGQDPLHHVLGERLAQTVLKRLFEHDRIDRDLFYVPVEHR